MDVLYTKLPKLKNKKLLIKESDNSNNPDNLKLNINKIQNSFRNISKTPNKLRYIMNLNNLHYKLENIRLNSKDTNINDENNLIKKFLYQNIKYKKYLKPIRLLSKNKSAINIYKNKYNFFFDDEYAKKIMNDHSITKENNPTLLLFKKYNRNFNSNPNLNKIYNINRYLIKKNENDTNGNFIFYDHNEELKESITFILNSNNSKQFIKKKLTKNSPKNRNTEKIDKNENNIEKTDDFRFKAKRFDSPAIRNIKRVKYIQELTNQKNKGSINNNKSISNRKIKLKKNIGGKYNYILKDKIKNIDGLINSAGDRFIKVNKLLGSCISDAKERFELDTKNIFGGNHLK